MPSDRHGSRWRIVRSADADAAPEAVLQALRRPRTWPRWQPEIVAAEGPEPLEVGDVVHGRARMLGFGVYGHSTTIESDGEVVHQDAIVGVRLRVRYRIDTSSGGRTRVTHELMLFPLAGTAGKMLGFMLRPRLRRMQSRALKNLVAQAEADSS